MRYEMYVAGVGFVGYVNSQREAVQVCKDRGIENPKKGVDFVLNRT